MLFWLGLIISLTSMVLSNSLFKDKIKNTYPILSGYRIDIILIIVFCIGIGLSVKTHVEDVNEKNILKHQIELNRYDTVASYNIYGNLSGKPMGVPMIRSPIQDWGIEYVSVKNGGKFDCKCDSLSLLKYKQINIKIPDYPFTYYFLSKCLKDMDDPSWLDYADKAISILEKTTKSPVYHPHHELILNQAKLLRNKTE